MKMRAQRTGKRSETKAQGAPKALVVFGGWEGHKPKETAKVFESMLKTSGFEVTLADSLSVFEDKNVLDAQSLIVPNWTLGEISFDGAQNVADAVASGVGLAGCHGGMCDAFRANTLWHFLTGAQWVAHPGDDQVSYQVHIKHFARSVILRGVNDFEMVSEQYYLHVDPAVQVLATCVFPGAAGPYETNGPVHMPAAYTKRWGEGRIFYHSLGHDPKEFENADLARLTRQGFAWAAKKEEEA